MIWDITRKHEPAAAWNSIFSLLVPEMPDNRGKSSSNEFHFPARFIYEKLALTEGTYQAGLLSVLSNTLFHKADIHSRNYMRHARWMVTFLSHLFIRKYSVLCTAIYKIMLPDAALRGVYLFLIGSWFCFIVTNTWCSLMEAASLTLNDSWWAISPFDEPSHHHLNESGKFYYEKKPLNEKIFNVSFDNGEIASAAIRKLNSYKASPEAAWWNIAHFSNYAVGGALCCWNADSGAL